MIRSVVLRIELATARDGEACEVTVDVRCERSDAEEDSTAPFDTFMIVGCGISEDMDDLRVMHPNHLLAEERGEAVKAAALWGAHLLAHLTATHWPPRTPDASASTDAEAPGT